MLCLPDAWIWDSWVVDDGERFHLFFLQAPRALVDPDGDTKPPPSVTRRLGT